MTGKRLTNKHAEAYLKEITRNTNRPITLACVLGNSHRIRKITRKSRQKQMPTDLEGAVPAATADLEKRWATHITRFTIDVRAVNTDVTEKMIQLTKAMTARMIRLVRLRPKVQERQAQDRTKATALSARNCNKERAKLKKNLVAKLIYCQRNMMELQ